MNLTLPEVLARLNEARATIDHLFKQGEEPTDRAAALTEMLRTLWPPPPLHACLLGGEALPYGSVCDRSGRARPEWLPLLRAAVVAGSPARLPLPAGLELPDHRLVWEAVGGHGGFAVAVPDDLPANRESALRTLLQTTAALLAARLDAEGLERERQSLRDELAGSRALADLAEVASPVAHEFNNFLNALLLHVAVLELKMAPEQRQGLAELRQQGKGMASLVQQWQCYRRRPSDGRTVDLNPLVRDLAQAWSRGDPERMGGMLLRPDALAAGVPVRAELPPGPLPVPGSVTDLKRLAMFLLRNAAAVTPPQGAITVRTGREEGKVFLRIADAGPGLDADRLAEFFDLGPIRRDGRSSLELAACKTLVRRLQGKIVADNGAERGVVVTVELPAG